MAVSAGTDGMGMVVMVGIGTGAGAGFVLVTSTGLHTCCSSKWQFCFCLAGWVASFLQAFWTILHALNILHSFSTVLHTSLCWHCLGPTFLVMLDRMAPVGVGHGSTGS